MTNTYIGIDVGKTKVAIGLVNHNGNVISSYSAPRSEIKDPEAILQYCFNTIEGIIKNSKEKPKAIGIGTLGVVDPSKGVVIKSSVWVNFNMAEIFEKRFGLRTYVTNDVRAAALGEYMFGSSRGSQLSVYLTISTGVSFCTIENGNIVNGSHFIAGQIGPLKIYENGSTLESKFSGRGIEEYAADLSKRAASTEEVFKLAYKDSASPHSKVVKEAVHNAAAAVAIIQNTVDPDIIVVGGSVANNQPKFIEEVKVQAEKILGPYIVQFPKGLNIVHSSLGKDSGVIGAACLAMHE